MYHFIISLLTSIAMGVGIWMLIVSCYGITTPNQCPCCITQCTPIETVPWMYAILSAVIPITILITLRWYYYYKLKKVYLVLIDGKESSFNYAFGRAWHLHFYKD